MTYSLKTFKPKRKTKTIKAWGVFEERGDLGFALPASGTSYPFAVFQRHDEARASRAIGFCVRRVTITYEVKP